MHSATKTLLIIGCTIMTGCSTLTGNGYSQFYEGDQLPNNEITILENHPNKGFGLGTGIYIESINDKKVWFWTNNHIELLPGKHRITATCNTDAPNMMTGKSSGLYTTEVELKAGFHYRVGGNLERLKRKDWIRTPIKQFLTDNVIGYDVIKDRCKLKFSSFRKLDLSSL